MLLTALAELNRLKVKYAEVEELTDVFRALERIAA
jgi:hypothetical protein